MRIALVGAGSLGTIAGALLSKGGLDVSLVDANRENVEALNTNGATITGFLDMNVPVKAVIPADMEGKYDLFIYLVKSTFDDAALPGLLPFMRDDSILITLQNGVPEERVAGFVGRERTLGGAVGWGGTWQGPGISELTSVQDDMTYDIGELDGTLTPRLQQVKQVLDNAGEAILTENLVGVRWTKLLVNISMSGLSTVLDCDYGSVLDDDRAITAAICIILETINTSLALGITMEPMKGVNPVLIKDIVRQDAENTKNVLKLIYDKHRNIVGSMLQDLRKELPCEVEALNGYMQWKAAEAGVKTPVNDQVSEMIRQEQAGTRKPGFSNIDDIVVPDLATYLE